VVVIPVPPNEIEVAVEVPRFKLVVASTETEPVEVRVVAPVPVRVEEPADKAKRVAPLVIKLSPLASVVPKTPVALNALPPCKKTVEANVPLVAGRTTVRHLDTPTSY
jgi:hypothetical protein